MRNRVWFVIFFVSVWGWAITSSPARAIQFGFSAGYSSIGFALHGTSFEQLISFGKGRGRPQGSGIRIGLAAMSGQGETDLTRAKWNGISYQDYTAVPSTIQELIDGGGGPGTQRGYQRLRELGLDFTRYFQEIRDIHAAYGITTTDQPVFGVLTPMGNYTAVRGDASTLVVSLVYEYVLGKGAPGLGLLAGAEYVDVRGGFRSRNPSIAPSVTTKGGLGGGGVLGVSYYLKNGVNFTLKTGLGLLDPGEVTLFDVKIEPESTFYASPTFAIGYMY